MFEWRLENKNTFYETLVGWWTKHKAFNDKIIPYKSLPNRIFIVSKNGEDLYAVPVYISDSDFCYLGFITSNPKAGVKSKHGALRFLYNIISIVMKSQGFDRIMSKTNERGLTRELLNSGFIFTEKTGYYIKNI